MEARRLFRPGLSSESSGNATAVSARGGLISANRGTRGGAERIDSAAGGGIDAGEPDGRGAEGEEPSTAALVGVSVVSFFFDA